MIRRSPLTAYQKRAGAYIEDGLMPSVPPSPRRNLFGRLLDTASRAVTAWRIREANAEAARLRRFLAIRDAAIARGESWPPELGGWTKPTGSGLAGASDKGADQ